MDLLVHARGIVTHLFPDYVVTNVRADEATLITGTILVDCELRNSDRKYQAVVTVTIL